MSDDEILIEIRKGYQPKSLPDQRDVDAGYKPKPAPVDRQPPPPPRDNGK